MLAISPDAKYIGDAIGGANWPSIFGLVVATLGTAIVSWSAAYWTAKWAAERQQRSQETSTVAAIHAELCAIADLMLEMLEGERIYTEITVTRLQHNNRLCSVYLYAADKLGLISKTVVDDVVYFYSTLIMLPGTREIDKAGKKDSVMDRKNMVYLHKLAKTALDRIESEYGLRRKRTTQTRGEM